MCFDGGCGVVFGFAVALNLGEVVGYGGFCGVFWVVLVLLILCFGVGLHDTAFSSFVVCGLWFSGGLGFGFCGFRFGCAAGG